MKKRTIAEIQRFIGGELVAGGGDCLVHGVAIDSRRVRKGDLFFALRGEHAHGVEYARTALNAGCAAVVVDPEHTGAAIEKLFCSVPILAVEDPEAALGVLAEAVRTEEHREVPAVAVTGSVGKTTTCRFAAALLEKSGVVHRPPASFNNHLGVPVTVLTAPEECQYLITEVGTNAPGEVLRYASWVKPRVAVVTAIAPAHLEGLHDLEQIELEKLSIIEAVEPGGEAWLPVQLAEKYKALLRRLPVTIRTMGPGGDLEVRSHAWPAENHTLLFRDSERSIPFRWAAPFPHSPRNLEAAIAIGLGFGVDLDQLLSRVDHVSSPPLRGEVEKHGGISFVLDCYNANPASLTSAIERLENEPVTGRRVCVIGTMEELGQQEGEWHRQLGGRLASEKLDDVFLIGRGRDLYASGLGERGADAHRIDDDDRSAELVASQLEPGDCVLFKASRRERLEDFAARVAGLIESRGAAVE